MEEDEQKEGVVLNPDVKGSVGQEQIHELLFGDKLSWQAIIYDLINTEQLNPWDMDLVLLTDRFLDKVKQLEEANFFVSSKVLLAASLLLRIKSEILLNNYLPSLDEVLFGKEEEKTYVQERIELDEDVPGLVPRTPLPRFRKVSLQELMAALGKAITTENRRIKKVVLDKQYEREAQIVLPRGLVNIKEQIENVYEKLKKTFSEKEERLTFSEFAGKSAEEKITTFVPLLHLDNQKKVLLEQEKHLEEIWIWLHHIYEKKYSAELEAMRKEVEAELEEMNIKFGDEERRRVEKVENEFENPLGDLAE
jgi:segregation and condensation protein A